MPKAEDIERQKLQLQREIARLSGQISSAHRSHPSAYSYGSRGRGFRGRGRGRGLGRGGYSLDLRSTTSTAASAAASASASGSGSAEREEGEVSPERPNAPSLPGSSGWIKKTSRGGNMSLMTVQKRNALAARPPPPKVPKVRVPPHIEVHQSTESSGAKRVVIDGVIFEFANDGKELKRIGEPQPGTPTRQTLLYGGEKFRRTKRGNLTAQTSTQRRAEQATKPCRYFTKTGRCDRALTCRYQHSPDRVAICPRFLRGACDLGAACTLSHTPSPHNTPSCVHFQATATCRNGEKCLYPHVRVAEDAPVCEPFAREGWCDAQVPCKELHIWECPEWHAKGTCARGSKCGLRHVLRKSDNKAVAAAVAATPVQSGNGFEDQSEFIGLPGDIMSETEDEDDFESEEEDEEDEEDDEDEEEDGDNDDEDEEMGEEQLSDNDEEDTADVSMAVDSGKHMSDDDDDELLVFNAL